MLSIVDFRYCSDTCDEISKWTFGTNWPVVYVIYNDTEAYVGETIDATRRTRQHLTEKGFSQFSKITLIGDRTFNKSVVIDLESFLIRYMSGDGTRKLTNGNAGIVNHQYFYRESYEDDFTDIWKRLKERHIVQKNLYEIENSNLYKYSPYKSLTSEQFDSMYNILRALEKHSNCPDKSIIIVEGGVGSGKTVLATYLIKLLIDIALNDGAWRTIDEPTQDFGVEYMIGSLKKYRRIGYIAPMEELHDSLQDVFSSVKGLERSMVLYPRELPEIDGEFDLLIVDETHRLYRRRSLPYSADIFDKANRAIFGAEAIEGSESDPTELDWIIKKSKYQILFYDEYQTIRTCDIGPKRLQKICRPYVAEKIKLKSQLRCRGGENYLNYIKKVIKGKNLDSSDFEFIEGYGLGVVDSVSELFKIIKSKNENEGLCKVVTGPGWSKKEKIIIDGTVFCWASGLKNEPENAIYSVHHVQGFDLNYCGVIFGHEVYYDDVNHCIGVDRKKNKDKKTIFNADEHCDDNMIDYILNIYLILMSRAINGTYIYAMDDSLRKYLKKFFR